MMTLLGQDIGNYHLHRLLGRGSSADVYLGEHKYHRSYVAVKVLKTQTTHRWEKRASNELHILSQVTHPSILHLIEHGRQDNTQFFITDWATQGTLLDLFAKSVPMSKVTSYVKQIAYALHYLHTMHITHCDIKPANILVQQDGNILLADFGSAVDYRNCYRTAGSAAYAAPEQAQGHPCPASDQYALAILVYQWLCSELPFHGSCAEMIDQHVNASLPPLRDKVPILPSAVEQVVLTALGKDPDSRFTDIRTFAMALEQTCQSSAYWNHAIAARVTGPGDRGPT